MVGPSSRRSFLARLLMASAGLPFGARAQQAPLDQGIGGTGLSRAPDPPTDQGIGGTGVVGTIRRFGSIYVNGLRITYPAHAVVTIDGRRATPRDMRIGHVVSTVARPAAAGTLSTSRIAIASEVVGAIDSLAGARAQVLGQTVDLSRIGHAGRPAAGARVAVYGRRRPDGVIVASLVEPAGDRADRVVGPVRQLADGRLAIGDLPIRGVAPSFYGARTSVEGDLRFGTLVATRTRDLSIPFDGHVSRVVIEDYVGTGRVPLSGGGYAIDLAGRSLAHGGLHVISGNLSRAGAIRLRGLRTTPAFEGRGIPPGAPHFDTGRDRPGEPGRGFDPGRLTQPQREPGSPGGPLRDRPGFDRPGFEMPGGTMPGASPGGLPPGFGSHPGEGIMEPRGGMPEGGMPGGAGRRR